MKTLCFTFKLESTSIECTVSPCAVTSEKMAKILGLILLVGLCHAAQGASILALFSSLSFSDHLVFRGYMSLLAARGHSLVVMTPYPGHYTQKELERIVELDVGEASAEFWDEYKMLVTNVEDYYPKMKALNELNVKLAISQLKSKQMQALFINPNIKFDLVITQAEIPLLYAVADKYQAPHVSITTSSGTIPMYESKGNPNHPILYPDVNTLNYRNLSVWQKYTEMNRYVNTKLEYYNNYLPLCQIAAEKILGLKRELLEVEYDIDMLFVSGNTMLIGNRPTVPAINYVNQLHIKPGNAMHADLKAILDGATKGVVYFSLGAIQDSEQLSKPMLQMLSDTFSELPYTVLWKIGNTTVINKPDNVVAQSWFPQQEVLAHPNVKVFLTHGGARSLEEAIFYKVPIVGFPIVRSRKVFIAEVTKFGTGEILDPYYTDKQTLKDAIIQVASNPEYKKKISHLKVLTEDTLMSGPEIAVWYTEYVIRHKGARHLRSSAVGVYFYQYFLLDIIGFLLLVTFASLWGTYFIVKQIWKRLRVRLFARREELGKFKAL